ncbi:MAG TPA: hypothetical protein DCO89_00875 [Clostridiales bacterium]|nr:hypothetical protein [Clostridiales bacterium]
MKKDVNIFFSCDDNYVPYLAVALQSLELNASKKYNYNIKVLHTSAISPKNIEILKNDYNKDNFDLDIVDISDKIKTINEKLHTRDYYSEAIYLRLFIPSLYPDLEKVLYLDCDIAINGDISKLYNMDLGDNYVAAAPDGAVCNVKEFQDYATKVIQVDNYSDYFNSGILLMNLKKLREINFEKKFLTFLKHFKFDVAPDQDYLNLICKNHVKKIDAGWNKMPIEELNKNSKKINIIHYNLSFKPWHKDGIMYEEYFWKYAKMTSFYEKIINVKNNYTKEMQEKSDLETIKLIENTKIQAENTERNEGIAKLYNEIMLEKYISADRLEVLKKIDALEANGLFYEEVENDPIAKPLMPHEVDYLQKKLSSKIARKMAYSSARKFMNKLLKDKQLIIKEIIGIENWKNIKTGAVITCNHFNAMDSFAMQYAYDATGFRKRKFYKVIKEGNYTSFRGFYGYLMRHCNTLPLSSNAQTMKKFINAVDTILKRNEFILVYPEQSMWWNYKKPKPLKAGAFHFAVRNNVPVLPIFITMNDSSVIGNDGFPVQEYTIHILKPIYPKESTSAKQNIDEMLKTNYELWKNCYETTYGIPLTYKQSTKTANVNDD